MCICCEFVLVTLRSVSAASPWKRTSHAVLSWRRTSDRKARGGRCQGSRSSNVHFLQWAGRWGYCFEGVSGAALAAVSAVERVLVGGLGTGCENRAGAGTSVALVASRVTDELADGAQRRQMPLPALQTILFVFNWIPGEENEHKAHKLEAGGQAEVHEAEGSDIVLPARAVNATVLLPEHAGGVNHRTKVDWCGNVGCRHGKREELW